MYIPTAGMDREIWRRVRQIGIGGSDAASILLPPEEYKYADPERLLLSKTTELPEEEESLPCRIGHALEPTVAQLYTEHTGRRVHNYNRLIISEKYPWMVANIDRKLYGANEGLECKTIGEFAARRRITDPETGEVSWFDRFAPGDMEGSLRNKLEWYVQMQHYMAVTGWQMWHLAVLIGNRTFLWYDVPRDDAFIAEIIRREEDFWVAVEEERASNHFKITEDITNGIKFDKRKARGSHAL